MFSRIFIERPRLAAVVSLILLLAGGMGMRPLMGFQQVGVNVFFAGQYPTVGAAVQAFLEGKLPPFTMDFTCGGGGHH